MVDYMFRMAPERSSLKERLTAGSIGSVRRVNVEWTVPGRASRPVPWSWQFDARKGGGALFAFGAHVVDYVHWLLGSITAVAAHFSTLGAMQHADGRTASIAEDTLDAILLVGQGIPVSVTVSNATPCGRGHWLTIHGEKGLLSIGSPNLHDAVLGTGLFESDPNTGCLRPVSTPSVEDQPVEDGRVLLVQRVAQAFVAGIAAGRPTSPSFQDGWRAQVTMDALRQAHAERRWVTVPS
jgi:predicted dehydrogenase